MPPHPDEALLKVTLNLYAEDVAEIKRLYGYGWSEQVRQVLRDFLRLRQRLSDQMEGVDHE